MHGSSRKISEYVWSSRACGTQTGSAPTSSIVQNVAAFCLIPKPSDVDLSASGCVPCTGTPTFQEGLRFFGSITVLLGQ
jgi:hypothetical protein